MKKIISTFIILAIFMTSTTTYAYEKKELKDMPALREYQEIIDKVNKELNTNAKIPEDNLIKSSELNREDIYKNITNQTLEEFENKLRNDLQDLKENFSEEDCYIDLTNDIQTNDLNNEEEGKIILNSNERAIREVITQNASLDYGKVYLDSEIFSRNGNLGTFTYSRIINMGYYKYTDRKHFRTTSSPTYSLDSSSKYCTVKYKGVIYSADGIILTSLKTYTIRYGAN